MGMGKCWETWQFSEFSQQEMYMYDLLYTGHLATDKSRDWWEQHVGHITIPTSMLHNNICMHGGHIAIPYLVVSGGSHLLLMLHNVLQQSGPPTILWQKKKCFNLLHNNIILRYPPGQKLWIFKSAQNLYTWSKLHLIGPLHQHPVNFIFMCI